MLVFQYPQRLDASHKTHCPLLVRSILLSWSALPLLVNHTKAVLLPKLSSMCLPFTSPHYNRARQQDPRVGVVSESVKLLIGVHYSTIPLLLEPALSLLGAGHLIAFGADQPTRISPWRAGRFL